MQNNNSHPPIWAEYLYLINKLWFETILNFVLYYLIEAGSADVTNCFFNMFFFNEVQLRYLFSKKAEGIYSKLEG